MLDTTLTWKHELFDYVYILWYQFVNMKYLDQFHTNTGEPWQCNSVQEDLCVLSIHQRFIMFVQSALSGSAEILGVRLK